MADLYNLKRFDLNLLIIFECIYQHLSISKAAQTLFITPSAVSQSLQRLRVQLNDPLFIRSGKGISPTTVAINLHLHLEGNLNNIEQTINIMGQTELKKRFVVYGPQFYAMPQLTQFMDILLAHPNMTVSYHDIAAETENIEELLNYRKADVVFTLEQINNRSLVCVPFCESPIIMMCRQGHPRLGDKTHSTSADLFNERFVQYTSNEYQVHQIKEYQKLCNTMAYSERNVALTTSSLMTVFKSISQSDLVGFAPKFTFELLKDALKLKEMSTNLPLPTFIMYMTYSRSSMNSSYFNEIIEEVNSINKYSPQK